MRVIVKGNHKLPKGDPGSIITFGRDLPGSAAMAPGARFAQTKLSRNYDPIEEHKGAAGHRYSEEPTRELRDGNAEMPDRMYNPDNMASVTTDRGDFRFK